MSGATGKQAHMLMRNVTKKKPCKIVETNGVGKRGLQHHTMLMVTPTAVPTQLVDDRWGR